MNSLNVWNRHWLRWTSLVNWKENIKDFFRCIKYSYQRIVKGYCDADIWNLDGYYADIINQTLLHLKDNTHGYPGDLQSEEEWSQWLEDTAELFYKGNLDNEAFENIYEEDANKLYDKWTLEPTEDGKSKKLVTNYTPEEEKLNELFLQAEEENFNKSQQCINHGLMRLSERWFDLWD